jgi:hypothetical protein
MLLLKFDTQELYDADAFLGTICFTLFIIFVVLICMNMLISIILDSFRYIRNYGKYIINEDYQIFRYIKYKFLHWADIVKPNELERQEERDIIIRSEYRHTLDYF